MDVQQPRAQKSVNSGHDCVLEPLLVASHSAGTGRLAAGGCAQGRGALAAAAPRARELRRVRRAERLLHRCMGGSGCSRCSCIEHTMEPLRHVAVPMPASQGDRGVAI